MSAPGSIAPHEHAHRRPAHPSLLSPRAARLASIGGLFAFSLYLHQVSPVDDGPYPSCPFRLVTGWDCPGCGSLRALSRLTHLDVRGALRFNAITVLAVPWLAYRFVHWVRGTRPPGRLRPQHVDLAFAVLFGAFGVARLLGAPGLAIPG